MTQPPGSYPPPGPPPPGQQRGGPSGQEPAWEAWGQLPPSTWQQPVAPPPGMLGAAHKPGAVPLRPLALGDIYDAAFRIIRFNPQATVGAAVLVAAVAMTIPVLATAVLTWTVDLSLQQGTFDDGSALGLVGSLGSFGLGSILQQIGLILVSGMTAHVVAAAAIGRRLSLGEAWGATAGRRWRLLGLSLLLMLLLLALLGGYALSYVPLVLLSDSVGLIVVYAVLSGPLLLCFLPWFWIRCYYLPATAMMIEDLGIRGAIGRGFRLTRRQFWRTFGLALLTAMVAGGAGYVLSIPFAFGGQVVAVLVDPQYSVLVLILTQALATVVSSAFIAPFTTAVASLQYLDLRIRTEAYDVELMTQAGITAR
ncbi:unannotated protein [freshwater metagenome]|uniref:Unannotated protein n=1 Tax=freshwater metagenome TaxID=449393 RepID=A0A6J6Q089_9ZZZZ